MLEDGAILGIGSQGIRIHLIHHTTENLKLLFIRGCLTQHQAKKLMNLRQEQNFTLLDTLNSLDTNMETAIRIIQKIERGRQGIVRALKAAYYQKR